MYIMVPKTLLPVEMAAGASCTHARNAANVQQVDSHAPKAASVQRPALSRESPAQAEEETRAAHNRPARLSRLARTLEESDAVIARQLQADEERLLLGMLTGAQDPEPGFWAAHERPAAPAPSLQARSHAHPRFPLV